MENGLNALYDMTEHDRTQFSRSVQTLLTSTFIIKQVDKDRELYRFTLSNFSLFETYFAIAGWHLRKDESRGIIACSGPPSASVSLNLEETLSLLVFRLLHEEKQHEISLHSELLVRQYEFHEKYKVLTDRMLNKTRMKEILHKLKMLKLIASKGDETDPETLIILYPSIAFVLDSTTIDDMHARIQQLSGNSSPEIGDEAIKNPEGETERHSSLIRLS
ncbi:MAG: DUF4194 domain-containing protein [Spirochaetales bacterium]|jgi:hypothetical protein|nr:DUF4194 domain-containing protein [Spirochaetales bacterium]